MRCCLHYILCLFHYIRCFPRYIRCFLRYIRCFFHYIRCCLYYILCSLPYIQCKGHSIWYFLVRWLLHYIRCFLRYDRHQSLQGAVHFGGSLGKAGKNGCHENSDPSKLKLNCYHLNCSMATMGRDVYLLRFMLSCRSNGEKQVFNFSGLLLSCRSNSEELTRFRTAADTVFQTDLFYSIVCSKEKSVVLWNILIWSQSAFWLYVRCVTFGT